MTHRWLRLAPLYLVLTVVAAGAAVFEAQLPDRTLRLTESGSQGMDLTHQAVAIDVIFELCQLDDAGAFVWSSRHGLGEGDSAILVGEVCEQFGSPTTRLLRRQVADQFVLDNDAAIDL